MREVDVKLDRWILGIWDGGYEMVDLVEVSLNRSPVEVDELLAKTVDPR